MTSRAVLGALERVFAAEIEGRLPFQSKAKIFERLCAEGLLVPMDHRLGTITVKGYQLTHAGRFIYCSSR